MDPKKIANNMLELLFDPTVIPVEKRLYFRPEERLQNEDFDKAKAESYKSFKDQRHNSDFYPKNTQREASIMDRKTIIASLDVLSQNFDESDPIGTDLRTMAYAVANMSEEELEERMAKNVEFVKCPKCGNPKVMKQTGYCLKCKTKGIGKSAKEEVCKTCSKDPCICADEKEAGKKCEKCGQDPCACAMDKEAGALNADTIMKALTGLSPQEARQVAQAFKAQKGKKASAEIIAKLGLGGKALIALSALLALAGSSMAGQQQAADSVANQFAKGDSSAVSLPKEEFSLTLIKDADRIMKEYEADQDVQTPGPGPTTPSSGGKTIDLSKNADFWSKEAAEAVQQAILSDVLPNAVVAKKKAKPAPAVEEVPAAAAPADVPAPVMAKEEAPAKVEEPKIETAKVEEPKVETAKVEDPKVVEPKEAQVVDTNILAYEGIELGGEIGTLDDVTLTATDKEQLDKLFN